MLTHLLAIVCRRRWTWTASWSTPAACPTFQFPTGRSCFDIIIAGGAGPGPPAGARPPRRQGGRAPPVSCNSAASLFPVWGVTAFACMALQGSGLIQKTHPQLVTLRSKLTTLLPGSSRCQPALHVHSITCQSLEFFLFRSTEILEESRRIAQPAKEMTDEANRQVFQFFNSTLCMRAIRAYCIGQKGEGAPPHSRPAASQGAHR